ncbi:MAG: hypothetical protein AAGF20_11250, partial [Pseudomonadota bacterium]
MIMLIKPVLAPDLDVRQALQSVSADAPYLGWLATRPFIADWQDDASALFDHAVGLCQAVTGDEALVDVEVSLRQAKAAAHAGVALLDLSGQDDLPQTTRRL